MIKQVRGVTAAFIICALIMSAAHAQQVKRVKVEIKEATLKNGLRVIMVEDHSAPVVAVAVTYNTGSRDERKGSTGFAHLFEHMMFKGSENVGVGEHFFLVSTNGGSGDATTSWDRTNYFQVLPSNQLELPLFLESDRMRSLAVTKENLDNQRNAVQEERRLRIDNQPYGKSLETMLEMMYDNFAYKHPVLGSMEDLNTASVEDIQAFFKLYYAPNNAVLTLVGDFDSSDALAKVKKHFEATPRQPAPPAVDVTEPVQTAERRATIEDALARLPQIDMGFKTVPGNTPDYYALEVLSAVLHGGRSSRLYQKLVKEKEAVTNVSGVMFETRGPGAFYISAIIKQEMKVEDVEALINDEIERLKKEPIADWELTKAKNSTRRGFINSMQNSLSIATTIGEYAIFYNDPNLINTIEAKVAAVTKEDVRRVAVKYLKQTNRTVVITLPRSGKASAPASEQ